MSIIIQIYRVVFALLVRELKTRFGIYKLGFLWAFLEPITHIAIFVGIRGILAGSLRGGLERFIYHIDYPLFLASGLIPFFLFRHCAVQLMHSISANRGLFAYQPVKPFDAFLARWVLEGLIFLSVWLFIFTSLYFLGFKFEIKNLLGVLFIYFQLYLFSLGVGMCFAIIGELYEEFQKIVSVLLVFLFFLSCIFYSVLQVPKKYQVLLLWNPLVHFIELSRENLFYLYKVEMCNYGVIIFSPLVSLFLGLSLYRLKIKEILSEK